MDNSKLVLLETPYAGNIEKNIKYARACMRDCLLRGEFPFASHLLYPQEGILRDDDPDERRLGMEAGFAWGLNAKLTVVYIDLGISEGMKEGIRNAEESGREIEYRSLDGKIKWE